MFRNLRSFVKEKVTLNFKAKLIVLIVGGHSPIIEDKHRALQNYLF